ncbi:MAG: ribonuclease Z [Pseudomonadota bacterium]
MDLVFLGTSSGTPTKQRNVTGLALVADSGKAWYLVDCGEATQHQLLHTPLSVNTLRAIFITHVHGDHCYGLPGLLASAAMSGRKDVLTIVAPKGIETWVRTTLELTAVFLPFALEFLPTESFGGWQDAEWKVESAPLSHRVPSHAYSFTELQVEACLDSARLGTEGVPQGPLWGRLKMGEDVTHAGRTLRSSDYLSYPHPARKIVVGGDNDQAALLTACCQDAQVLVHEATYTQEVADKAGASYGHSSAASVAAFAETVGLPNLVLTHFSARYQSDPNRSPCITDIQSEAATHYKGQLFLAEDFARFRLSRSGQLSRV